MKCKTCGFAASDASITVCPFCKGQGMAPAYAAQIPQAGAAVWPPAPTVAQAYPLPGHPGTAEMQKQRSNGILMAILPLVAFHALGFLGSALPSADRGFLMIAGLLAGLYPHFRGCAHWAEAKGYPRYEGRLLGILGWLGVLLLAIRPDKSRLAA